MAHNECCLLFGLRFDPKHKPNKRFAASETRPVRVDRTTRIHMPKQRTKQHCNRTKIIPSCYFTVDDVNDMRYQMLQARDHSASFATPCEHRPELDKGTVATLPAKLLILGHIGAEHGSEVVSTWRKQVDRASS